jgi:FkbM family methyltransferase
MILKKIIEKYRQNGPKVIYQILDNLQKTMRSRYKTEGWFGVYQQYNRQLNSDLSPKRAPIEVALQEVIKEPGFTIIQIGAYVGNSENDPLFAMVSKHLKECNGQLICIEPVAEFFAKLKESYKNIPNVYFENVAIADKAGEFSFYRLGVDPVEYGYPEWLQQLGSLKMERMEKIWDNYENNPSLKEFYLKNRIEEKVQCLTFQDIIQKYSIKQVDLLQIDVEGYEYEILSSINYSSTPIRFINYESVLLQKNKWSTYRLLKKNGFRQVDFRQDTFAYHIEDEALKFKWIKES